MVFVFYFVFVVESFFMANIFVMYIVHNISEFLSPLQSWICMRFGGPILICATPRKIAYTKFPILRKWLRGIAHVHWTIFAKTLREVSSLKKVSISYAVLDMWRRHMILRKRLRGIEHVHWTKILREVSSPHIRHLVRYILVLTMQQSHSEARCFKYIRMLFSSGAEKTKLQVWKNIILFRSPKKQNDKIL